MKEKSNFPLVSIITPAYNAMPFLKTTIESVLNQEYPNLEHIVFDGGSTDNSIEVLKSYSHLTWFSEKDRGQSHAINKGFAIAKGEIIGWVNADDTYEPNAILDAVNFLVENPEYDLVGTDMNIIDENDNKIGITLSGELDALELLNSNPIKQTTVFMRRTIIDKLIGVKEEFHFVMDQELWLRIAMSGFKFKYLKGKVFANFRLVKGTKTFESGPEFILEWHNHVLNVLVNSYFDYLTQEQKNKLIKKSHSKLFFSKFLQSIERKERINMVKNFIFTIQKNPPIFRNLGLWKFLLFGLLDININRLNKFKKNEKGYDKRNI